MKNATALTKTDSTKTTRKDGLPELLGRLRWEFRIVFNHSTFKILRFVSCLNTGTFSYGKTPMIKPFDGA
jgi:hypothetical protein